MIIQRLFSSKEQKARKEKYEVLKGQDLVDQRNREFHKTADEVLNQAAKEKLPENHPKVKRIELGMNLGETDLIIRELT